MKNNDKPDKSSVRTPNTSRSYLTNIDVGYKNNKDFDNLGTLFSNEEIDLMKYIASYDDIVERHGYNIAVFNLIVKAATAKDFVPITEFIELDGRPLYNSKELDKITKDAILNSLLVFFELKISKNDSIVVTTPLNIHHTRIDEYIKEKEKNDDELRLLKLLANNTYIYEARSIMFNMNVIEDVTMFNTGIEGMSQCIPHNDEIFTEIELYERCVSIIMGLNSAEFSKLMVINNLLYLSGHGRDVMDMDSELEVNTNFGNNQFNMASIYAIKNAKIALDGTYKISNKFYRHLAKVRYDTMINVITK